MAGEKIIFRNPLNNNDKHQMIQNLNKMNRAAAISNEHFIVTMAQMSIWKSTLNLEMKH
mgnify:CR=1 FL=1